MLVFISVVLLLIVAAALVLKWYPAFGGKSSKRKLELYRQSPNFDSKRFVYPLPSKTFEPTLSNITSLLRDYMKGNPKIRPESGVPIELFNPHDIEKQAQPTLTWFGHSSMLLQIGEKRLLLDPMFGKAPTPFPIFGNKRYSRELPFEVDELPAIDAVILSHDHYDHLDYGTIIKLKDRVARFIVPLGVSSHLERWGVDRAKISEHDWWDEFDYEGLKLACTPARHFSGRGLFNGGSTLWCSWVIVKDETRVFFSGDSGYGAHFEQIGDKYGPFDLTLMECGQYDTRWSAIHMMPEETVRAHVDVKGKVLIPIHWSAFTLALHDWNDPIERVTQAARKLGVNISTPKIGESVPVGQAQYPSTVWWRL